jgi:ABC-type nitrate/sulfonate/bicarbonate transport system permease component
MNTKITKILSTIILLIIIQLFFYLPPLNNYFLPSPIEVIITFFNTIISGELIIHSIPSLYRVIIGFLIATFFGILIGLLFGITKKLNSFIGPIIEILRPIPPIAWIPISILIFGLGDNSAYFIVFLGAFFPIFTNTLFGVKKLPKKYVNLSKTLELSRFSFFKNVLFKFSLPYIFTGLKIGIGMAWMSVIAAELIGAQSGLGYFIQINRLLLNTDKIVVGMITIGILGFLLVKLIGFLEKKLLPWESDNNVSD